MALILHTVPRKHRNLILPEKKIKSTADAMAILSQRYWKEIAAGRVVAKQIALEKGTVTTREMVNAMIAEGMLVAGYHPEHWVSVVFRDRKTWEWTGQVAAGTTTNTQGGKRWSKVWKLRGT